MISLSRHGVFSQKKSQLVEELAIACKALERRFERELEADLPWVIRLDGVNFKRFTAKLKKPFDERFTRAMILTAKDLLEHFSAQTAFCQSDEISLFLFPKHSPIPFSGRTQKISSVASGFASVRFVSHFQSFQDPAWFDARVFSCADQEAAAKVAMWRHLHDCRRNAVNAAGAANFSHESLQNQGIEEVIERLEQDKKIDFYSDYPKEAIYGAFLKKRQFEHYGFNPITKKDIRTTRCKVEAQSIDFSKNPGALTELLCAKYWEGEDLGDIVNL